MKRRDIPSGVYVWGYREGVMGPHDFGVKTSEWTCSEDSGLLLRGKLHKSIPGQGRLRDFVGGIPLQEGLWEYPKRGMALKAGRATMNKDFFMARRASILGPSCR